MKNYEIAVTRYLQYLCSYWSKIFFFFFFSFLHPFAVRRSARSETNLARHCGPFMPESWGEAHERSKKDQKKKGKTVKISPTKRYYTNLIPPLMRSDCILLQWWYAEEIALHFQRIWSAPVCQPMGIPALIPNRDFF